MILVTTQPSPAQPSTQVALLSSSPGDRGHHGQWEGEGGTLTHYNIEICPGLCVVGQNSFNQIQINNIELLFIRYLFFVFI